MLRPAIEDWESLSLGSLIKSHELFILKRAITRTKTKPGGCSEFKSDEEFDAVDICYQAYQQISQIKEVFAGISQMLFKLLIQQLNLYFCLMPEKLLSVGDNNDTFSKFLLVLTSLQWPPLELSFS